MKTINCIGDSHSSIFSGKNIILPVNTWISNGEFKIFHAGPVTAFNCNKKPEIAIACNSIPKDEYFLFIFGEIDMRCRVGLSDDKFVNIDLIIENYFKLIDNIGNENIIISGVVPCLVEEPMKDWFDADETRKAIFTATRGSLEERNAYKKYFNEKIKKLCEDKGYGFIDCWDEVIGKTELYKDDVHLNGELVVGIFREYIKKLT